MKKILLISAVLFAAVGLFWSNAAAYSLTASGLLTLDENDTFLLGWVAPGHPSGESDEESYIDHLTSMLSPATDALWTDGQYYTRTANLLGATYPAADFQDKNDTTSPFEVELNGSYPDYVLGKYGVGPVYPTQTSYVWYTGALNIDWTTVNKITVDYAGRTGLSHVSTFGANPVPEPATMLLFGLGLLGLAGVNRRKK